MGYQHRIAPANPRPLEVTGVKADVAADGETVTLTAETALGPVPLALNLASLSALVTELTQAGRVMLSLQRGRPDRGMSAFEQLAQSAPTVVAAAPTIGEDGGISIVYRFADRMPMALRFSFERFMAIREDLADEIGRLQH